MMDVEMACVVETGMPNFAATPAPGRCGLSGEAVNGMQFDTLMAERPDDAPAARRRPAADGERAHDFHPDRDLKFRRLKEVQPGRQGRSTAPLRGRDSASAIMPNVFCASLLPWLKPM